jgi:hypothetical protein
VTELPLKPNFFEIGQSRTFAVGCIASICFCIVIVLLASFGTSTQNPWVYPILLPLAAVGIAGFVLYDRSRVKQLHSGMAETGYRSIQYDKLDEGLRIAYSKTHPLSLTEKTFNHCFTSKQSNRVVVLCDHGFGRRGRYRAFASCAVRVDVKLPEIQVGWNTVADCILPTDRLGHSEFDTTRTLHSEDMDEARKFVSRFAEWLIPQMGSDNALPRGFEEMWSFSDQWIVYATEGNATTSDLITMSHYLASFVESLEAEYVKNRP